MHETALTVLRREINHLVDRRNALQRHLDGVADDCYSLLQYEPLLYFGVDSAEILAKIEDRIGFLDRRIDCMHATFEHLKEHRQRETTNP